MFTSLKADGSVDKTEVFAEGWLDPGTRQYRGRPVDVANMADGSILVGIYLVEQLKAYRSGKRRSEVMNIVAKPLTDADISELAA